EFASNVDRLLSTESAPATFAGYLSSLAARRAYFQEHGATSTDHGVVEPYTLDMDAGEAETLFQAVLRGAANAAGRRAFRGHMLLQMARLSVEDGLVMTLHAGVF
ncbi:glucuronate isomerase, partial [Rhizobium johnstonii]|uniref:glucuronate isomerase n=1 Tax=Rhizobium johnstonii TaxID=3019933 RepID=UPI003F9DED5E